MRDNELDTTVKELKHLLLPNQYYAELTLDCECFLPYKEQSLLDYKHEADCSVPGFDVLRGGKESDSYEESDTYELNSFAMEGYVLRPIPYVEYVIHETPNRMKNIFAGLEYDPLLTVGLWDKQEGSFYGEKVPYLQRRRADRNDAWETHYRHAEYLSSRSLGFDHVEHSEDKSLFLCAVAININETLEMKVSDLRKRISHHFRRLVSWTEIKQSWQDLLECNKHFLQDSHEKKPSASFDAPYLGYLRQDCEEDEEYRSLIHLTDNGLLVLGGQGPDRGLDWRGGHTFRSTHKEYRRLPCLEFVVQSPASDFISNLIADVELAVNIHRGDGSVYTRDPNCCEYLHRELKPDGLWEQQQVSERSLRHFCLDHLPVFRREEVLICTVAMKITENNKDMLMGKEEDFEKASTAFDLIHRILSNKGSLVSWNDVKNLRQLSEVHDDFINQNFEHQDVEHLKMLRRNGLFVLKGPELYASDFTTYKVPLLKLAALRGSIKHRFFVNTCQDPKLAVGSWDGQDGHFIGRNRKILAALRVHKNDGCFPKASKKYRVEIDDIPTTSLMSVRDSVLEGVEPLKEDFIIFIIAMRVDELIQNSDKTKLLEEIENFDIAKRVAAHIEAVNSADSVSWTVSSKRTDDSNEDHRSHTRNQNGIPQQLISGLTNTKELTNQPEERRSFDINFNDLRIKGIMPRGDVRLYDESSPEKAYIVCGNDIPDPLKRVKGKARHLESKDVPSLHGVKLWDIEVGDIAVGGGNSISVLGSLHGESFVMSKTTLNRAFSKEDAEDFWEKNSQVLKDACERRESYAEWRKWLRRRGSIRRSNRVRELKAKIEGSSE